MPWGLCVSVPSPDIQLSLGRRVLGFVVSLSNRPKQLPCLFPTCSSSVASDPTRRLEVSLKPLGRSHADTMVPSKALPKFISALSHERRRCWSTSAGDRHQRRVLRRASRVQAVHRGSRDRDRQAHARRHARCAPRASLAKRFTQADATVDGVLCWDIFDFLEPAAAGAGARSGARAAAGGAVMGSSAPSATERAPFTKFEIIEESSSLRHRHHPGPAAPKFVLQNRDIIKMFDGLSSPTRSCSRAIPAKSAGSGVRCAASLRC